MKQPLALAITGASGAPYWRRLLQVLLEAGQDVHVVWSSHADEVCRTELNVGLEEVLESFRRGQGGSMVGPAAPGSRGTLQTFAPNDFRAPMASGSAPYAGMAIVPCSLGTLGRIAHGVSSDLVTRAADVMLKERRRLVVLFREMPLSLIHLENMAQLTRAGAVVMPAAPGFYHRPQHVGDLVDFVVQRVCTHLGIDVSLVQPWGSGPTWEDPSA